MTAKTWTTPGVYVSQINAFPQAVVGVATAVPVFIGHTAMGVALAPVRITSLADYESMFGGGATGFNLHDSIALFYENGGGVAFVVSAGGYGHGVDAAKLTSGLAVAEALAGVTLIAIPDAVLLPPDPGATGTSAAYAALVRAMLAQCGSLQDRFALLDLYGTASIDTSTPESLQAGIESCITNFQAAVGSADPSWGAAYFPFLKVQDGTGAAKLLPPSGAMAGVYTMTDQTRGVWNAPANVALTGVLHAAVSLAEPPPKQLELALQSLPATGTAVNAIRDLTGRGAVVWGAHTLDGDSNEWRYVQVRRTVTYIKVSIKDALQPFVFATNDAKTWAAVTAMISAFLTQLWQQGGLMGDKASDAFSVQCGLGSTMTGQDILNGTMIVDVTLAMIRPAEFIVLTFTQNMEGA